MALAGAAATAAYFCVAIYLKRSYASPAPPGAIVVQITRPFDVRGFSAAKWSAPLAAFGDDEGIEAPQHSPAVLYEDGKPLGPGHSTFAEIATEGHGRYFHGIKELIFSSSDNSDPNRNGRRYWLVIPKDK